MTIDVIATKQGMTQAWTKTGKRMAITRCMVEPLSVIAEHTSSLKKEQSADQARNYFEVGYGRKKLKNMTKPLRTKLEKGGFSFGVKHIEGIELEKTEGQTLVGQTLTVADTLSVGDVVKVQGISKGRGFAGAVKRHGFKGGPKTHGQSDRLRAVGSIGSGTDPGRVEKGKRMPGHFGTDVKTVSGLVVLYVNAETQEVWLSGPVPGANSSIVKIQKTGDKKDVELDLAASGLEVAKAAEVPATEESATTTEVTEEKPSEEKAA